MGKGGGEKEREAEGTVRPSISVRMIRHAESRNNQVYRDAWFVSRGGTPEFKLDEWQSYVDRHRSSDPPLSDGTGSEQRDRLADFLVPHFLHQASHPVHVIVSPMRRTLETIRPTVEGLRTKGNPARIIANALYYESDGCHDRNVAREGMTPDEIKDLYKDAVVRGNPPDASATPATPTTPTTSNQNGHADNRSLPTNGKGDGNVDANGMNESNLVFECFPDMDRGWNVRATGAETRVQSEARAARFYVWLCEYLDEQLRDHGTSEDVFDAGVCVVDGERDERDHDKHSVRKRKRRMAICVGHGDFMSLVLKRIVSGFGHAVETEGITHRSAFVHYNTGMTELEYFGSGRWLVMGMNQTPHFNTDDDQNNLRTGGSLKDGWAYLMPIDKHIHMDEHHVSISYEDDDMEDYVQEQAAALKSLYLPGNNNNDDDHGNKNESGSGGRATETPRRSASYLDEEGLMVEELDDGEAENGGGSSSVHHHDNNNSNNNNNTTVSFFVKRGLQVVGCATYDDVTGQLSDVVVRPSARGTTAVGDALLAAVRAHVRRRDRRRLEEEKGEDVTTKRRSGSLYVKSDHTVLTEETRRYLERLGFQPVPKKRAEGGGGGGDDDHDDDNDEEEDRHEMDL